MVRKRKPTTSKWVLVKKSRVHGTGVFAKRNIPKNTFIIEYVGEILTKKKAELRADEIFEASQNHKKSGGIYIFELTSRHDVDGSVDYNTARYINHSCDPNCETENDKGKHIWINSLRDIKRGEELNYNYGYGIDEWWQHPCKCRSSNCAGYIAEEDLWPQLKRRIARRKNA